MIFFLNQRKYEQKGKKKTWHSTQMWLLSDRLTRLVDEGYAVAMFAF